MSEGNQQERHDFGDWCYVPATSRATNPRHTKIPPAKTLVLVRSTFSTTNSRSAPRYWLLSAPHVSSSNAKNAAASIPAVGLNALTDEE